MLKPGHQTFVMPCSTDNRITFKVKKIWGVMPLYCREVKIRVDVRTVCREKSRIVERFYRNLFLYNTVTSITRTLRSAGFGLCIKRGITVTGNSLTSKDRLNSLFYTKNLKTKQANFLTLLTNFK